MNQCLTELFADKARIGHFLQKLPVAFEMAANEMPKSNPAIGILREHIIIGYLIGEFSKDRIMLPEMGNERAYDVVVCGEKLSIKTMTGSGLDSLKVVWTADQEKIAEEIKGGYYPSSDMLLVIIQWNKTAESVFYIPHHVQSEIFHQLGSQDYLKAAMGTNHRGINISSLALKKLLDHTDTLKHKVNWVKQGLDYTPYKRWEDFWSD